MEPKLPNSVVSRIDITRMQRELNKLDDFFANAQTREVGSPVNLPKLSRLLEQFAQDNAINILEDEGRKKLGVLVENLLLRAPSLHISFAAEPSSKALERILVWFRQNVHPHTLLQVGLQPTIAAGCILRTQNKVFDMSMREYLNQQGPYLVQLIDGAAKRG